MVPGIAVAVSKSCGISRWADPNVSYSSDGNIGGSCLFVLDFACNTAFLDVFVCLAQRGIKAMLKFIQAQPSCHTIMITVPSHDVKFKLHISLPANCLDNLEGSLIHSYTCSWLCSFAMSLSCGSLIDTSSLEPRPAFLAQADHPGLPDLSASCSRQAVFRPWSYS